MALSFFGSGSSAVKLFEIRSPHVLVLRGSATDAPSVELHGALVLCLSESMSCRSIKLSVEGSSRVGILDIAGTITPSRSRMLKDKSVLIDENWTFVDHTRTKSDILEPGNYEWPFHLVISGSLPESLEGLKDSWVVYRMKATIERGRLAHDILAHKPLRIVRAPSSSELEMAHDRFVENVWPGKVDYRFSVASGLQIFGSSVRVDLKIVPLAKGLQFGNIKVAISENQQFRIRDHKYKIKREVASDIFHVGGEPQLLEETSQDGWQMPCVVALPRRLSNCLPNVNTKGIEITHNVQVTVDIHNDDGHVSEVIAAIGIHIYISPDFMVDESNQLSNPAPSNDDIQRQLESDSSAPPRYEHREMDQLWGGIDPALYTPTGGPSGVASPYLSRSASLENLASLTAMNPTAVSNAHMAHPQLLTNRLQNVQLDNSTNNNPTPNNSDNDHSGAATSISTSPVRDLDEPGPSSLPRSNSSQFSQQLPGPQRSFSTYESPLFQHLEHAGDDDLCKVPSYRTAVRSSIPDPINAGLPNYDTAISSHHFDADMIRPPAQVHVNRHLGQVGGDPRSSRPSI